MLGQLYKVSNGSGPVSLVREERIYSDDAYVSVNLVMNGSGNALLFSWVGAKWLCGIIKWFCRETFKETWIDIQKFSVQQNAVENVCSTPAMLLGPHCVIYICSW